MAANHSMISQFKKMIPQLQQNLHKGQSGRIGIVGGSKEYTGAPYFASISSLRVGADLSYVLTTKEAAPVIKSYSPEIIVLPILDMENNELEMRSWIGKVHSLIIGPGLGRSDNAYMSLKTAFNCAKSQDIPVVIDADGLFLLSYDTSLVSGYEKCILTPNFMEFKRLYETSFKDEDALYDETKQFSSLEAQSAAVQRLAQFLRHVTIVKKGKVDIISDGRETAHSDALGSIKRCGGLGDLLTGSIGTFAYWCNADRQQHSPHSHPANITAAFCASTLVRECSRRAFNKFRRSVLAVDVIEQIPEVFYEMFDKENF